jgi:hypothetical protein
LALEKKIRETKLRSWDDVASDLVAAILGNPPSAPVSQDLSATKG